MTRRICMWSGPRNVSTALMYSFAQRRDTRVVDEPLYAHYLRASGATHPGRGEILAAMPTDGREVMLQLASEECEAEMLFAKQMAHHFLDLDTGLLEPFEHFLLLRDPREMLPSLLEVLDDARLRDTGLPDQVRLVEGLESVGKPPFCIESKALLLDPERALRSICARLDVDFDPAMLTWPPGPRPEDGVWARWWYANVHQSTGFQPWHPSGRTVPEDHLELLEQCLALYRRLQRFSISV